MSESKTTNEVNVTAAKLNELSDLELERVAGGSTVKYTEKGGEKTAVAIKDASKATATARF